METKNKWYNDKMLLMQLIIIPPIFFYGLYFTHTFPSYQKKIISISSLVIVIITLAVITLNLIEVSN
ncbi:MAG: hypothetical protein ACWIPI_03010 [Polaribacter sp.]